MRFDDRDGVSVLGLREPPANTYSYEMMRELDAAILDARMNDAVVLPGTGAARSASCGSSAKLAPWR